MKPSQTILAGHIEDIPSINGLAASTLIAVLLTEAGAVDIATYTVFLLVSFFSHTRNERASNGIINEPTDVTYELKAEELLGL